MLHKRANKAILFKIKHVGNFINFAVRT